MEYVLDMPNKDPSFGVFEHKNFYLPLPRLIVIAQYLHIAHFQNSSFIILFLIFNILNRNRS